MTKRFLIVGASVLALLAVVASAQASCIFQTRHSSVRGRT